MGTDFELAAKNNILLLHNLKHCLLRFFMGEKKKKGSYQERRISGRHTDIYFQAEVSFHAESAYSVDVSEL